jgi:hypothetical protein
MGHGDNRGNLERSTGASQMLSGKRAASRSQDSQKACQDGGATMNYSEKYWIDRLGDNVPEKVQKAIKRVYSAYPAECLPQGLCDPMYFMNIVALELGIGDGKGNFSV